MSTWMDMEELIYQLKMGKKNEISKMEKVFVKPLLLEGTKRGDKRSNDTEEGGNRLRKQQISPSLAIVQNTDAIYLYNM